MKGVFTTDEVVNFLFGRVPRSSSPQFRLQNFLLARENWRTSLARDLHVGEQGEMGVLNKALGSRADKITEIREQFRDQAMKMGVRAGSSIFPTKKSYKAFLRKVRKSLGKKIILEV